MRPSVLLLPLCLSLGSCGGTDFNTPEAAEQTQKGVSAPAVLSEVICVRDGPEANRTFLCNSKFRDSGEEFRSRVVIDEDGRGISSEP